jgi:hypothetical protein
MKAKKAPGIDKVTKDKYEENLIENWSSPDNPDTQLRHFG